VLAVTGDPAAIRHAERDVLAYACVGNSVSAQRCSPAADRRIVASIRPWRALDTRACFLGSLADSSRALTSAMIPMRTSAFSATHFDVGGTQSSCSSLARSKKAAWAPSVESWRIGRPPARSTSS
jgi:hypothetical protein